MALAIASVLIAALVLSTGGSGARALENAAQRSRGLIALACERALLGGRDIGFAPAQDGLHFGYFAIEGWRPLGRDGSDELRARPWGDGVAVQARRGDESLPLDEAAPAEPPFACFASGELTPFRIEFRRDDVVQTWRLDGALNGELTLTLVDDAR